MALPAPLRLAVLGALALPLLPAAALAASAVTSQSVTMRAGPADSFGAVGQLQRGANVDVRQCEGNFCQVRFDGKTGWVSADYLTRGPLPAGTAKPATVAKSQPAASETTAAPQVATTTPKAPEAPPAVEPKMAKVAPEPAPAVQPPKVATVTPKTIVPPAPKPAPGPKVADLPPVPPAPAATPTPKPAATAPKIASTSDALPVPKPKPRPVLPLPPAYDETTPASAAPQTAEAEVLPLPGPRPKVDIPSRPSRDFALADVPPPPRDIGDDDEDWGPPGEVIGRVGIDDWPRHPRRDFTGFGAGGGHVCFVDPRGGSGFCVREGDRIVAPHRWARHALELRNPGRLNVVVCDLGGDCRTYQSSAPLVLGGRSIAEITVAAPGY
jgi:uncharacterized protein YraI